LTHPGGSSSGRPWIITSGRCPLSLPNGAVAIVRHSPFASPIFDLPGIPERRGRQTSEHAERPSGSDTPVCRHEESTGSPGQRRKVAVHVAEPTRPDSPASPCRGQRIQQACLSTFVMIGQNRQSALQQEKADHDFVAQEQELKTNTDLTRDIHQLTQEIDAIVSAQRGLTPGRPRHSRSGRVAAGVGRAVQRQRLRRVRTGLAR